MRSQPLGSQYLLDEQIGRGGMGVVWRGHDRTTGAVYAIKVVRPEYARDPVAVARFVRERTALVALRHPNVVTVHDMIVEGDQLALVMELVSGGDLDGLRKERGGRLAPAEAASLAAQVGDALAAAHAAGIVHRDLKPANVLCNIDRVLLADFGIVALTGQPRVTSEGQVLGTATHLSPEVIGGQEPGPAGDVYALGITLYELLAGQPPFTGNAAAILHAHGTAAPPRAPGIPDALWEIIGGCLAKDPASRPSATEVAAALHAFAAAPPSPAGASESPEWVQGAQLWPDPLQAVPTVPGTAERPPLATASLRRTAPLDRHRRTMIIAAVSVAAVVLLTVGAITLNPFRTSPSAQQQAQLAAGPGQTASQSASAAAARAGKRSRSASSHVSGSKGATGQQSNGPSSGDTRTSAKPGASASSKSNGTGSSGSTPSPSSTTVADADGLPILYASTGQEAHECTVIGSASDSNINETVEGVVCADVLTSSDSGGYVAQGQLELICQTTAGADVQCADVIARGELANETGGVVASTGSYQCGHSYGSCATGRNYVKTGAYSYSGISMSACSSSTSSATDAWGLAVGGGDTKIELPGSDEWVSLSSSNADDGANQSTGHHYICP